MSALSLSIVACTWRRSSVALLARSVGGRAAPPRFHGSLSVGANHHDSRQRVEPIQGGLHMATNASKLAGAAEGSSWKRMGRARIVEDGHALPPGLLWASLSQRIPVLSRSVVRVEVVAASEAGQLWGPPV